MFIPNVHAETRVPVLRQLIHDNPLGVLTTAITSDAHPLILSSHIPWVLDVNDESSDSELGLLRGHLARQNPQSKAMMESINSANTGNNVLEQEVSVLFTAAPQHYVTPKFYVETKPTTAKVVPTWNYAAVQVYGRAKIYFNSASDESIEFLGQQIHDLSEHAERSVMDYTGKGDRPGPWKVTDAPERYIDQMKKNIIGIEISIERLEGKFKMSQEMRPKDRMGVVQGYTRIETDAAKLVAAVVQERSDLKEAARG